MLCCVVGNTGNLVLTLDTLVFPWVVLTITVCVCMCGDAVILCECLVMLCECLVMLCVDML